MFGFVKHLQGLRPLLAPHVDDAQIRIRSRHRGIRGQHLPEVALSFGETPLAQRTLTALEEQRGIYRCGMASRCSRRSLR